jgi:hypothetical protein
MNLEKLLALIHEKNRPQSFCRDIQKSLSMVLDDYNKQILQSAVSLLKSSEISELTGLLRPTVLQHYKKPRSSTGSRE